MEGFLVVVMALMLIALTVLILVGGRPLRAGRAVRQTAGPWPRVALLVPVTGAAPGLRERLTALLSQDYPDYQVVFATRDAQDPATAVIRSLLPRHLPARHVIAGPARNCGQKNQNLLAAVQLVSRGPEILVFCDSNQEAAASWLRELVAPILAGKAQVVSGYHHLMAAEPGVAALGRAVTILALYLTKGFPRLNQPWGGGTAIRRVLFEELGVAKLWAENIVDDVSLAARLVQAGIPVGIPQGASLYTHIERETLTGWRDWVFRQLLYLKFCKPLTWLVGGLIAYLLVAVVLLAVVRLSLAFLGMCTGLPALAAALFLAGLTGLGLVLRSYHPQPGPPGRWLAAYFAAMGLAVWCHMQTLFAWEMNWRGIVYRVGWQGRVVEIVSSEQ